MPPSLFSLRHAGAVGAAALVAGGTFAVAATSSSGVVGPGQLTSSAAVPEQSAVLQKPAGGGADDFFAAQPDHGDREDQREENRVRAETAVDAAVRSASGEGSEIPEPEPEPETEADSSGGSDSSGDVSTAPAPSGSPKEIALQMVLDEGWGEDQFSGCLEPLWEKESNWNHTAQNPSSGAYGIPQSLPGSKMASHGDDWQTNPATQIAWGIDYIKGRYGDPCGAWSHSQANNWY
ncbi:aggregation-promoting factor C-terminal-like domain-containing protein [Nocardiopsis quinghaiensis]|uniref:aggregation-promoting factor C-terminal-like domain-containing protein n=1 Tax=Nocardiopsis quinghaiensis TaxID=464995 RepID=UPI001239AF9C|nr:lytic transglycosylase domain-containing protein [Nocardiopsis quinghaiensis]